MSKTYFCPSVIVIIINIYYLFEQGLLGLIPKMFTKISQAEAVIIFLKMCPDFFPLLNIRLYWWDDLLVNTLNNSWSFCIEAFVKQSSFDRPFNPAFHLKFPCRHWKLNFFPWHVYSTRAETPVDPYYSWPCWVVIVLLRIYIFIAPLLKKQKEMGYFREYWMLYRGPGFLADAWFGSSPIPSAHSPVIKLFLFISLPVCHRTSLLSGEGRRGWWRSQIIDCEKAWSSLHNSFNTSLFTKSVVMEVVVGGT